MQCKDQLGRLIDIPAKPKRIICLVPSLTELLVDLGLENKIIGLTKFCVHPKDLKSKKTIVGGTKNIKIDKIKQLHPDFILCNKEENSEEIVTSCEQIAPTFVSDIYNLQDTLSLIDLLGRIFSCEEKAAIIGTKINQNYQDFKIFIKNKERLKVVYFIWKDPWMGAGKNTFIDYLLGLNNFDNVFGNRGRYPEIELSELNQHPDLDVILLSSEPYPFQEKHLLFLKDKTDADVHLVDGEFFSWYGSRLINAFDYFKQLRNNMSN